LYLELYPDIIFIINFGFDFILLLLLRVISRRSASTIRLLMAAAVGGLIAGIAGIFPWMNVIIRFILMAVISIIILLIAYGRMKISEFVKLIVTFYLLTYFFGGLINTVYYHTGISIIIRRLGHLIISNLSLRTVILCFIIGAGTAICCIWLFRIIKSKERLTLDTELILGEKRVLTKGLVDTGNCLYDPVFKKPVIIVENILLKELLSEEQYQKLLTIKNLMDDKQEVENNDLLEKLPFKIRFIPYSSIGRQKGILLGLVLDKVLVKQKKGAICNEKVIAAIYDNSLASGSDYHVILHKELL